MSVSPTISTTLSSVTATVLRTSYPPRGHQSGTKRKSGAPGVSEAPDSNGGPSRTRTLDPLIKSHFGEGSIGHHRTESTTIAWLKRAGPGSILCVASSGFSPSFDPADCQCRVQALTPWRLTFCRLRVPSVLPRGVRQDGSPGVPSSFLCPPTNDSPRSPR